MGDTPLTVMNTRAPVVLTRTITMMMSTLRHGLKMLNMRRQPCWSSLLIGTIFSRELL